MRFIYMMFLALTPLVVQAQGEDPVAQFSITNQNALLHNGDRDRQAARFSADWWATVKGPLGGWGYGYVEKNYFETVHGLYLMLPPSLEIGAAIGLESFFSREDLQPDSTNLRYAFIAGIGDVDKLGIEAYVENGSSRNSEGRAQPWARVIANWQVNSVLALGVLGQFAKDSSLTDGFGPRIGITLPDTPLELYGTVSVIGRGASSGNVLFGVKFTRNKYLKK